MSFVAPFQKPFRAAFGGAGGQEYYEKVLALAPGNLLAFWRLNETTGTVAADSSGNNYWATYINAPSLANAPGPDGVLVPLFDGVNQSVDLDTASRFRYVTPNFGKEGSCMLWGKMYDLATWTDGTNDLLLTLRYNAADDIHVKKDSSVVYGSMAVEYIANGTRETGTKINLTTLDWFFCGMTWSLTNDQFIFYYKETGGSMNVIGPLTTLGTWTGLDWRDSYIGAYQNAVSTWKGWMALCGLWTTPLSQAQMEEMATV